MCINISATLDNGYQEHQRGNFDAAIEHYDRVLTANPKEAEALSLKGLVLCMLKRFAENCLYEDICPPVSVLTKAKTGDYWAEN